MTLPAPAAAVVEEEEEESDAAVVEEEEESDAAVVEEEEEEESDAVPAAAVVDVAAAQAKVVDVAAAQAKVVEEAAAAKATDAKKRPPNYTEVGAGERLDALDDAKEVVNDASHLFEMARTFYNQLLEIVTSISDNVTAAMREWIGKGPLPPVGMNIGTGMNKGGMNEETLQQPIRLNEARNKLTKANVAAAAAVAESVATALAASEAANTMNDAKEAVSAANMAENASDKVTAQNTNVLEVAEMFNRAAEALSQLPESVLSYCTTAENCCRCLGQFLGNSKHYVVEYTRNGSVSASEAPNPAVQLESLPDSSAFSVLGAGSPERSPERMNTQPVVENGSPSMSMSPRAEKDTKKGGTRRSTSKKSTHRKPRRHTRNYQSRNKRKHRSNKKSTIKHRKSYRKHNRTVKRRKSRRHH
jgi:hypothetical protein